MKGLDYMEKNKNTKIIAIANEKGGVAKTTSAINIAAGLSDRGKNVLLVDMDSQAHLSDWIEFSFDGKPTISEYIYQTVAKFKTNPEDYIRNNGKLNLDFIPATQMLAGVVTTLGVDSESATVLNRMFSVDFFNKYDFIIIDCGPTLDLRVTNAIICSDVLLIPVQADPLAYKGTDNMLKTYLRIKSTASIDNDVIILPTMYHNTNIGNEILNALTSSYGKLVLSPIPYRTTAVNSSAQKSILIKRKSDEVGKAYMQVVDYLIGGDRNE